MRKRKRGRRENWGHGIGGNETGEGEHEGKRATREEGGTKCETVDREPEKEK